MSLKFHNKNENLLYLALWTLIFLTPVVSLYVRSVTDADLTFRFDIILNVWKVYAFFLVIFLIHNFILAPMLVYKKRWKLYTLSLLILLALVGFFSCGGNQKGPHGMKMDINGQPMPRELNDEAMRQRMDMEPPKGPNPREMDGDPRRVNVMGIEKGDAVIYQKVRGERQGVPPMVGEIDLLLFIILVLMIGINLAVKYYVKSVQERLRLQALEQENLQRQLSYLKFQINPHFFMNTLNNIHALVDIDAERAKVTIEQLSKMMRYILYDGDKNLVPLDKEIEVLKSYIELMRIRYTDKVDVKVQLPSSVANMTVPPLIFMTFVENAFKHGVSYQKASFVDIAVRHDDDNTVFFSCKNSKKSDDNEHGGVGIANAKKRLDLIYGEGQYQLVINDGEETYDVTLMLPGQVNTKLKE